MEVLHICGGRRLMGEVPIHGAKNSALPLLAATLLVTGECCIQNCPRLSDVDASLAILRHLGCGVQRDGDTVTVDATAADAATVTINKRLIFHIRTIGTTAEQC